MHHGHAADNYHAEDLYRKSLDLSTEHIEWLTNTTNLQAASDTMRPMIQISLQDKWRKYLETIPKVSLPHYTEGDLVVVPISNFRAAEKSHYVLDNRGVC